MATIPQITPLLTLDLESINRLVVQLVEANTALALEISQLKGEDGRTPTFSNSVDLQGHRLQNVSTSVEESDAPNRAELRRNALYAERERPHRTNKMILAQGGVRVPHANAPEDAVPLDQLSDAIGDFVTGPTTSTDNAVARWDGTTGKILQDSALLVNDTGKISSYAGSAPTDGQVLIGDTAEGAMDKATLTAGTGITITNGAGAITIASSVSSTQGKHTIWVPAGAMVPTVTAGATESTIEMSTNDNTYRTLSFADGSRLNACVQVLFPKAWNHSTVTYRVYWTLNSTSTNTAVWGLQGVSNGDSDALDVAYGTAVEVSDAGLGTAYDLHVSAESSALTIAGSPADPELVDFKFYRDPANGSDNLAVTAELIGIAIYYTTSADTDA